MDELEPWIININEPEFCVLWKKIGGDVKEGKRIVCKVLDINKQTGNIDLSLRRVSTSGMIEKLNDTKHEEKAEKLMESAGKPFKLDLKAMYDTVGFKAIERQGSLYNFFQNMSLQGKHVVEELPISKELKEALYKIAVEKIKPVEVIVSGVLTLKTYAEDGILSLRKILTDLEKGGAHLLYLGAPKYKIELVAKDYKSAEQTLKTLIDKALEQSEKLNVEGEFSKSAT